SWERRAEGLSHCQIDGSREKASKRSAAWSSVRGSRRTERLMRMTGVGFIGDRSGREPQVPNENLFVIMRIKAEKNEAYKNKALVVKSSEPGATPRPALGRNWGLAQIAYRRQPPCPCRFKWLAGRTRGVSFR